MVAASPKLGRIFTPPTSGAVPVRTKTVAVVERAETTSAPETEPEAPEAKAPVAPTVYDLLKGLPDAPTEGQVEDWKRQFGKVFVMGLDDTSFFFWRPIKRLEYRNILKAVAEAKGGSAAQGFDAEAYMQDQIVSRCVLYPKIGTDFLNFSEGGTVPLLFDWIMESSNFIQAQAASALVRKL